MRELWAQEGKSADMRSVEMMPFRIDRSRAGVPIPGTERAERRLTSEDADFTDVVIRAAVAAIRRVQALGSTLAADRRLEALPETASEGGAIFAERLRERIAAGAFDVSTERPVHLTVSIGIATFPSPRVASTEDLFARADEALYRAKSGGRNQVRT